MTTATEILPITEVREPADHAELAGIVRECFESGTPVYPIGGGTSLDYGLPAKREGVGVSLTRLCNVVDYPARDMTITVEAGVTMQTLAETLAQERQRLPIDIPQPHRATLGGVVATNSNDPRRYGHGTVRDHVIGICAVDGRGTRFKGGGRVVKNVAGYDFCKLLTGSLGTLGVITQVTLKLKPIPEDLAIVSCTLADLDAVEKLLAALAHSATTPAAIELLAGSAWPEDAADGRWTIAVALEGTEAEVQWMVGQLMKEWREQGVTPDRTIAGGDAQALMTRLAEFPAADESPLVLRANVVPSGTASFVAAARQVDPGCSIQAHAGNGVVIVRFTEFPRGGLSKAVVGTLDSVASAAHGNVIVLSNPSRSEMTRQCVWGGIDAPFALMGMVKKQFDPKNILNPDRFVY